MNKENKEKLGEILKSIDEYQKQIAKETCPQKDDNKEQQNIKQSKKSRDEKSKSKASKGVNVNCSEEKEGKNIKESKPQKKQDKVVNSKQGTKQDSSIDDTKCILNSDKEDVEQEPDTDDTKCISDVKAESNNSESEEDEHKAKEPPVKEESQANHTEADIPDNDKSTSEQNIVESLKPIQPVNNQEPKMKDEAKDLEKDSSNAGDNNKTSPHYLDKVKNKFKSIPTLFKKRPKPIEDIFSTTEEIVKLTNTNPLDCDDTEISNTINIEKIRAKTKKNKEKKNIWPGLKSKAACISKQASNSMQYNALEEARAMMSTYKLTEYNSAFDSKKINSDINKARKGFKFRAFVVLLMAIASFTSAFLIRINPHFISNMNPYHVSLGYISINAGCLLISALICIDLVINGSKRAIKLRGNPDTLISLTLTICLFQTCLALLNPNRFSSGEMYLYACIPLIGLYLNLVAKVKTLSRIKSNFRFICSPKQNSIVKIYSNDELSHEASKRMKVKDPTITYQRRTDFITDFICNSLSSNPGERLISMVTPLISLCSFVLFIIVLIKTKDILKATSAFAVALCASLPVSFVFTSNLQLNRLCKLLLKKGAMLTGFKGIKHFSKTSSIIIDAKELYPEGSIELKGIKTFNGKRIDEAIVYAAALVCEFGGPLSTNFEHIIHDKTVLPRVDNQVYEHGKGIVGWVNGQRVLIGNRQLIKSHGIEPPTHRYENENIGSGNKPLYFAIGGRLVAMFILSYTPCSSVSRELKRLELNDIGVIVRTVDPNITAQDIARDFGIAINSIQVMSESQGEVYKELVDVTEHKSPAGIATKGKASSFIRAVVACVRAESNISLVTSAQTISMIMGVALTAFLSIYAGVEYIGEIELCIYHLFWLVASVFVPYLLKP